MDQKRQVRGPCNTGGSKWEVFMERLEMPQYIQNELYEWAKELRRPSFMFQPKLSRDGDLWCVLLGDNLQEGLCAFGVSPEVAFRNFDIEFAKEIVKYAPDNAPTTRST